MQPAARLRALEPMDQAASEPRPFHAEITPHRSMSPSASRRIEIAVVVFSVVMQAIFAYFGIWIVTTFMFMETVAVVAGLRIFARWIDRAEHVSIEDRRLVVRRFTQGAMKEEKSVPLAELVLVGHQKRGFGLAALEVRHANGPFEIASDLLPNEREAFRDALSSAIRAELNR